MEGGLYILYLDRYNLDDELFVQGLARMLARAGAERPACVVVHGSGERAERGLEAEGLDVERDGGVLVARTAAEREIVERAVRESNQKIVNVLTDAIVHAVGLQGADRGLVQVREDGGVGTGRLDWIRDLAEKQVVPVISALSRRGKEGAVVEVDAAEVAICLAEAFGAETTLVFFTKSGRPVGEGAEATVADLEARDQLPDPGAVVRAVGAGLRVLVGGVPGLLGPKGVAGTRIVA